MNKLETSREELPNGVRVFKLSGDLMGSTLAYTFQDEVRREIAGATSAIVVDTGAVQRIDSSGVGILVTLMWSASNAGKRMILTALPSRIEKVLSMAMLLDHVEHAPTLDEALARL